MLIFKSVDTMKKASIIMMVGPLFLLGLYIFPFEYYVVLTISEPLRDEYFL